MLPDPNASYLFLFAHPDDDVFICGTMHMLLQEGAEVHAAWLTSGDYFGQGELRESELAQAVEILGLHDSRVHLLRQPDLGLVPGMGHAAESLTELLLAVKPDMLFVTAFEGGHPDHDSANFLAYECRARAGLKVGIFEFPLYNGTGPVHHWRWRINGFPPRGPEIHFQPLNDLAVDCKYRMMRTYSSQWMYMAPARLASRRSRLKKFGEPYRACPPDRDHTIPPHAGLLNYERWFNFFIKIKFADYADAVRRTRTPVSPNGIAFVDIYPGT
jgi:LmbE family N-acetylglucosaminyl deacetylase